MKILNRTVISFISFISLFSFISIISIYLFGMTLKLRVNEHLRLNAKQTLLIKYVYMNIVWATNGGLNDNTEQAVKT
jgi:hypothetical protein